MISKYALITFFYNEGCWSSICSIKSTCL